MSLSVPERLKRAVREAEGIYGLAQRLRHILPTLGISVELVAARARSESVPTEPEVDRVDRRVILTREGQGSVTIIERDLRAFKRTSSAIVRHFELGRRLGGRRAGAGRPKGRSQPERIQVYLTPPQAQWVRAEAAQDAISESAVVGRLIDERMKEDIV